MSHKLHDGSYGTLYIDPMISVDCDQASGAAERWKMNESGVVSHDRFQVVRSICNHPV